ncbi:hypothetical protein CRG98_018036 [Punica granatum]|uniref:Uncharacterized protein n=1 Tax=Punica granatum TaxID=22663 RepID=A0A2I0K0A9_PUNGR|nr:hypothetical protein CRG98_018036 [Punica granatum]
MESGSRLGLSDPSWRSPCSLTQFVAVNLDPLHPIFPDLCLSLSLSPTRASMITATRPIRFRKNWAKRGLKPIKANPAQLTHLTGLETSLTGLSWLIGSAQSILENIAYVPMLDGQNFSDREESVLFTLGYIDLDYALREKESPSHGYNAPGVKEKYECGRNLTV